MISMQNKINFDFNKLKKTELKKMIVLEVLAPLAEEARKQSSDTFKKQQDIQGNKFISYTPKSKWLRIKKESGMATDFMIGKGNLKKSIDSKSAVKTNMSKVSAKVGSNVKYGHYHLGITGQYKNNVQRKWFFSSNAEVRELVLSKISSLSLDKNFLNKFKEKLRTSLKNIGKKISSK
tara:strand:+ start:1275 stop:1808 length:534 start_codon:yes stop_codon:yes gene_type:complete